jgi:hypothetical protein
MRVGLERHGNRSVANRWLLRAALSMLGSVGSVGSVGALGTGCGNREELPQQPPRGRGIGPIGSPTDTPKTQPSNAQGYAPEPMPPAMPSAEPALPSAAPEEKPPRDFNAELLQMMGSPSGCLNARTLETASANIDISLSTSVMPSGSVAQSEVQGGGLEAGEKQCLRSRLETLHFGPPIENAPFTVRGTLHLTRATAITPTQPTKPAPANSVPNTVLAPATTPNDLTLGNPEVGAPPLNAPDPP